MAFNRAVRREDEWFDEPDDLDRLERALAAVTGIDDPVEAAARLAFRVTRAQPFGEGNKRTALLLASWLLDRSGEDGRAILPLEDREFAVVTVRHLAPLLRSTSWNRDRFVRDGGVRRRPARHARVDRVLVILPGQLGLLPS